MDKMINEVKWQVVENAIDIWNDMTRYIKKVGTICEESKENR